jgi:hypothetical protein
MDWSITLTMYVQDNAASAVLKKALNDAGVASQSELHLPPDPTQGGVKQTTRALIKAEDPQRLEAIVRERYGALLPLARSWEFEAESGEIYHHFEGTASDYDDVAAGFGEEAPEASEEPVAAPAGPAAQASEDVPETEVIAPVEPKLSRRLADFLD